MAEHHDRDVAARRADDPGQRPAVGTLVPALALCAGDDRRCCGGSISAWRASPADAERLRDLGAPHVVTTGNLKLDVPAPPADRDKLAAAERDRRPADHRGGLHPCRRRDRHDRRAPAAARELSRAADADRAAPSRARRRHRRDRARRRAATRRCARAASCPTRPPTSTSPTRWANSAWSIGWRRSCSSAARWSSHGGQNPIEAAKLGAAILHGPHVWNFAEIYAALDQRAGAELVADAGKLTAGSAPCWRDPAARARVADAARATVEGLGGALERTLQRSIPI